MTPRVLVCAWLAYLAMPASVDAQTFTYQGALPTNLRGPRSIATGASGELYVADASGQLYRLTRRGDLVAKLIGGVTAVAAGPGVVFAATQGGAVVQVSPSTGRVIRSFPLGTSEAASALAFDAKRGKLWIAFESGMLLARDVDGAELHALPPAGGAYLLKGLALDGGGNVLVLQDRTGAGATMHTYDGATASHVASVPVSVRIAGGMAIGPDGLVNVSDVYGGTVRRVDSLGADAGTIGSGGTRTGELNQPMGLGFLANGDLVVANMDAGRLERFGGGAPLPECAGDTDCDGLSDEWESAYGLDPFDPSNAFADADGDGLNDAEELIHASNPRSGDTDGDGYADGEEVASGFDPRDPDDHRPQVVVAGERTTDPGLVRIVSSVHDPVSGRGACSIDWAQVGGAPVVLRGKSTASPSFVARAAGVYGFEAVASCGGVSSLSKRVEVAVNNVAPRADGGRVVALRAGSRVQLSAAWSTDANADALRFRWDQVVGPAVSGGVEGEALATRISGPGYYAFRVSAVDGRGAEGAADVPVLVLDDAPAPAAKVVSPVRAEVGGTVTLDASGSYRGEAARFTWVQLSGPEVSLGGADRPTATFSPPAAGAYSFQVSIAEGSMRSPPAKVEVYVAGAGGALPVARASAPKSVAVDSAVTLDGSASSGGTGALMYAWRQVSGPAAGLTRADRETASVVLFQPGSYEFELTVSDAESVGVPARVRVEARTPARPIPVAVATAWPTAHGGDLVLLDGRASTGGHRYRWTQVEGPWVVVQGGPVASFVPPAPGVYGFELEVDDGSIRSAPARVNVVVIANGTEN